MSKNKYADKIGKTPSRKSDGGSSEVSSGKSSEISSEVSSESFGSAADAFSGITPNDTAETARDEMDGERDDSYSRYRVDPITPEAKSDSAVLVSHMGRNVTKTLTEDWELSNSEKDIKINPKIGDELLRIEDLSIEYHTDLETVYAVNHINLSIREGETLGLVGETGAGKTTTALGIMGLLPKRTGRITSGEICYRGNDLIKKSDKEMEVVRGAEISMIFQDPMTALNPVLTVGDQIEESLRLHNPRHLSRKEMDSKVEYTLEMVGIPKERKTEYPYQFSGGMRQRVVIAIALICSPKLLIADEPTTALDVTIQAQILSMISDLQRRMGTSVIMITHDLGVVAETCDKVGVMYSGEIVEYGSLADIFTGEFHHPYTIGLFGSIPSLTSRARRLTPIEGLMPDPTLQPPGCRFAPRCRRCMEICTVSKPHLWRRNGHKIYCHLYDGDIKEKEDSTVRDSSHDERDLIAIDGSSGEKDFIAIDGSSGERDFIAIDGSSDERGLASGHFMSRNFSDRGGSQKKMSDHDTVRSANGRD